MIKWIIYWVMKHLYTPIKRSVRNKLLLIMLAIGVIPLVLATFISYVNSKAVMEREVLRQNTARMEWVQNDVTSNLERLNEGMTSFFFDQYVNFYLNKVGKDQNLQSLGNTYYREKLENYYLANYRDLFSISFYAIDARKAFHLEDVGISSEWLDADFIQKDPFLSSDAAVYLKTLDNGTIGFFMKKYYYRFEDQKPIAILTIQLKWDIFKNSLSLLNTGTEGSIYVLNESGSLVQGMFQAPPATDWLKTLHERIPAAIERDSHFMLDRQYVFFTHTPGPFTIVKTIPVSVISRSYLFTLNTQLGLIFLTAVLVIFITLFIGFVVAKPITKLAKSMQNIERYMDGTLNLPDASVRSNDEIRILEQSYLMMLQRISQLINEEYKQKIAMQSAQLMALKAQINPHFMYNTLQMIGSMAIDKNSPEIYDVISAFASMMRYNMHLPEDLVTVEEELQNLKNYIEIQQKRFEGKLAISYELDETLRMCMIPKLSLQPIVENCYKHGFTKKMKSWQITLSIRLSDDDTVAVAITDNGNGISPEKLHEIRTGLAQSTSAAMNRSESFGLSNIDSRIKLYFGASFGLTINSEVGAGTCVNLTFPVLYTGKEKA